MRISLASVPLLLLFCAATRPRAGQLRDSGLRVRHGCPTHHHGRAAFELHCRRPSRGRLPGGDHPRRARNGRNHAGHQRWSEVGFYIFTSEQSGLGAQWVGDHIRPRVRVPDSWRWPVGASLSMEMGYQRAKFSPDTWTWEIRPIVDKTVGPLVLGRESCAGAHLARA